MKPRAYFLIGAPSTGRTTFRKHLMKFHSHRGFQLISTDEYLHLRAQREKRTFESYDNTALEEAKSYMDNRFRMAVASGANIVLDLDPLLTYSEREIWLSKLGDRYNKIAVLFEPPFNHKERNEDRKDHKVSWENVVNSLKRLERPTEEEGFDDIVVRRM